MASVLEETPQGLVAVRPVSLSRPREVWWKQLRPSAARFAAVFLTVFVGLRLAEAGLLSLAAATTLAAIFVASRHLFQRVLPLPLGLNPSLPSLVVVVMALLILAPFGLWTGSSWGQLCFISALVLGTSGIECVLEPPAPRRRVLVVGASNGGGQLVRDLEKHPALPFDVIGVVDDARDADTGPAPRLGATAELATIVLESEPDLLVLADPAAQTTTLSQLLDVATAGFRVIPIHQFHEHAFGRVPVDHLTPAWFMSILHLYQRSYSRFAKRAFDLTIATFALPFLALFVPLLALLVRLTSAGPILFRQVRLGENGEPFEMIKFRTMVDGVETPGSAVWADEGDPRITRIGRLMRRMRLDELPQLWNVVRGDMSIVGPRPERPEFLALLEDEVPFWTRRHLVKPGLTGWAQVRHPYTGDVAGAAEKLSYDLYYLKHRSLRLDLAIVAMTAMIVAGGFGSR